MNFLKGDPARGLGTKSPEAEAKCEISVRVPYYAFSCTLFRI